MGREQIQALVRVLQGQLASGRDTVVGGTWEIRWNKARNAFEFDKCEFGGYCEERPSVIAIDGSVLDAGGPLLQP
jgi:hypothetical protein